MINLDRAAGATPYPKINDDIQYALELLRPGPNRAEANSVIADANEKIAHAFGFLASEISWYGSATAAISWLAEHVQNPIYCSSAEHLCSRRVAAQIIPLANLKFSDEHIQKNAMVICSLKNNEFGFSIHSDDRAFLMNRPKGMLLCIDATGGSPSDPLIASADFVFAAPSKWGGLPGCGFLLARADTMTADGDAWTGWGKGTPSLVNILTTAGALEWRDTIYARSLVNLDPIKQTMLDEMAEELGWEKNGSGVGISNWSTEIDSAVFVPMVAENGVLIARGAACSSGSNQIPEVALALLGKEKAERAIRISWDPLTDIATLRSAIETVTKIYRDCKSNLGNERGELNE